MHKNNPACSKSCTFSDGVTPVSYILDHCCPLLVHETLDQKKEARRAWVYNSGQRRVRRAPNVAYDGPGAGSDGLRTSDNYDMYNGSPDRYNWKLLGKKAVYIPYNSYKLLDTNAKYSTLIQAGHLNPDYLRYELHRIWEVEATLKEVARHIYAKRTFYIDEDTWSAAVIDQYDARGELWKLSEGHGVQFYDVNTPWMAAETLHDLNSGRYLVSGLRNEEPKNLSSWCGVARLHVVNLPLPRYAGWVVNKQDLITKKGLDRDGPTLFYCKNIG